jgi:hypothetical protein
MTHSLHGFFHGIGHWLERLLLPVHKWLHWMFLPKHGRQKWEFIIGAVLLGALVLFLLDRFLNSRNRRRFVLTLTFIAGFFYALEYLLPGYGPKKENFLTSYIDPVGFAWAVIGAFALSLGMINLGRIHGKQVVSRARGYHNSVAFFAALVGTMVIGFIYQYDQNNPAKNGTYHIMFDGFLQPLGASMFATLGFYITSAAYRAFRIRSREAMIMLVAGFIVMLGQVPVGSLLTRWIGDGWVIGGFHLANLRFERLAYWILTVPNAAAVRAIGFGIEVGGVAMGLRLWMSLERGSYFDKEF